MTSRRVTLVENQWHLWNEVLAGTGQQPEAARDTLERYGDFIRARLSLRSDPFLFRTSSAGLEVRASGIAGSVVVNSVSLEVVPKFMARHHDYQPWSVAGLTLAHYLNGRHMSLLPAKQRQWRAHGLVELLGLAFAEAVERGLEDQLIQRYQAREETLPVLRGRLNVSRQMRSWFNRPHLLECDVDQLDSENPFNDVLKWAATLLSSAVYQPSLRGRLIHLAARLPGRAERSMSQRHLPWRPPPQFGIWAEALDLARFLAEGYSLPAAGGFSDGHSIVFNMEKTFERFVEVLLHRCVRQFAASAFAIERQVWTPYATPVNPSDRTLHCRPDNVVSRGDTPMMLVDAKYKLLQELEVGEARGTAPRGSDMYELIVGMVGQGCTVGLLVYPQAMGDQSSVGALRSWFVDAFGRRLRLAAVPIDLLSLDSRSAIQRMEKHFAAVVVSQTELLEPAAS